MGTVNKVGVVGAGRMGLPIIGHLARKGFAVVVHDANAEKRAVIEGLGAVWADDAASLAGSSEVVLVCVGYDREVQDLLGPEGALQTAARGTIVAVLSTVLPKTVQALAASGESSGIEVIDSTVCRGGAAADDGTLLSFVGGSHEQVERVRPVLAAYSSDIVHTGAIGSAQVAKAANNLILWACLVADHEGLALAQRYGLDPEVLRKALAMSSCANGPLDKWGTQTMAWAEDDLVIVGEMANDVGLALPQAGLVREICRAMKPRRYQLEAYGR
jgi:3-hydroxyisobutyrate dehydrogenase